MFYTVNLYENIELTLKGELKMDKETVLTKEGKRELEEQLHRLETTVRQEIVEKIKEALSFGDLSENAEYSAAKEAQSNNESEILRLTNILANATVIDEDKIDNKKVSLGCYVTVLPMDKADAKQIEYQIVGTTEAKIKENKISNESPVGKALLNQKKDAVVKVLLPNGKTVSYKIIKIRV